MYTQQQKLNHEDICLCTYRYWDVERFGGQLLGIWQEFDFGLGQGSRLKINTAEDVLFETY